MALMDNPSVLNDDPLNEGWLVRIEMDTEKELFNEEEVEVDLISYLRILIENKWYPIIRYDTSHNFAHCDILHWNGKTEKPIDKETTNCNKDNTCDYNENSLTCPSDCICGDKICDNSESFSICPGDCKKETETEETIFKETKRLVSKSYPKARITSIKDVYERDRFLKILL